MIWTPPLDDSGALLGARGSERAVAGHLVLCMTSGRMSVCGVNAQAILLTELCSRRKSFPV